MTLTTLLILVIALAVVFTAGVGFQVVRRRQHAQAAYRKPPALFRPLDLFRERAAQVIAPQPRVPDRLAGAPKTSARRQRDELPTGADLQPIRSLVLPGSSTVEDDSSPGIAVTAAAAGPADAPQQDAYYVQRNLIALARGLTPAGDGHRAAALTLSAIMTSKLGQTADVEQALREGATAANRLVRSISQRDPQYSNMVTTLDVVYVAFDGRQPQLHFAHVGSSAVWLQRAGSPGVEQLTKQHLVPGGPVLRAVGLTREVAPDTGRVPVDVGDRIFLTTAGASFAFTEAFMNATAGDRSDHSLHDVVTALTRAATDVGTSDEVTVVGAEIARPSLFLA